MRRLLLMGLVCWAFGSLLGQTAFDHVLVADSVHRATRVPILSYAIVSADSVLEMQVFTIPEYDMARFATELHPFRIGSNTKAVTGMVAAILVQQGKIGWETRFFDLFPEWKAKAHAAYHGLTLLDLLSFRNCLPMWTYYFPKPKPRKIKGNPQEQRTAFANWALRQDPTPNCTAANHSNLGFVAAGLMLEKASGQSMEMLWDALAGKLSIDFRAAMQPGQHHSTVIPGFDADMKPQPTENPQLNWLMAAGGVRISLRDYARFMQEQLRGLQGKSEILPRETFEFLHFGLPEFAVGWFWGMNAQGQRYSHNLGNPGNGLTRTMVVPDSDRAYIVFANCMTPEAYAGTDWLMKRLASGR